MHSIQNGMGRATTCARIVLLAGCAVLAGAGSPAAAADLGVGVQVEGEGETILMPIRLQSMIVEPEISYDRFNETNGSDHSWTIGTGLYARKELAASFETYYGARISYSSERDDSSGDTLKDHTWALVPTLGFQYFLAKQFSVGFDAGVSFSKRVTTEQVGFSDNSAKEVDTVTRVLVRAYF